MVMFKIYLSNTPDTKVRTIKIISNSKKVNMLDVFKPHHKTNTGTSIDVTFKNTLKANFWYRNTFFCIMTLSRLCYPF